MAPQPYTYQDPIYPYSCTVTPVQSDSLTLEWNWVVQRTDTGKILESSKSPLPSKVDALARALGVMNSCIVHRRSEP